MTVSDVHFAFCGTIMPFPFVLKILVSYKIEARLFFLLFPKMGGGLDQ